MTAVPAAFATPPSPRAVRRRLLERVQQLPDVDLARILRLMEPSARQTASGPAELMEVMRPLLVGRDREAFVVVFLDTAYNILGTEVLTVGGSRYTVVEPKQVARQAIAAGATSVAVGHNHPSGNTTPSQEDILATKQLQRVLDVVGIALVDHLICVDSGAYVSLAITGQL